MLGFFETANICASGMTAQRARIDVIASNISNAETTRAENGEPYRRKAVIFAEVLNKELENISTNDKEGLGGVKILKIEEDKRPFQLVFNPDHPDADENGYVKMPNVNVLREMVDLINAQRAYEANVTVLNATKSFASAALQIGKG